MVYLGRAVIIRRLLATLPSATLMLTNHSVKDHLVLNICAAALPWTRLERFAGGFGASRFHHTGIESSCGGGTGISGGGSGLGSGIQPRTVDDIRAALEAAEDSKALVPGSLRLEEWDFQRRYEQAVSNGNMNTLETNKVGVNDRVQDEDDDKAVEVAGGGHLTGGVLVGAGHEAKEEAKGGITEVGGGGGSSGARRLPVAVPHGVTLCKTLGVIASGGTHRLVVCVLEVQDGLRLDMAAVARLVRDAGRTDFDRKSVDAIGAGIGTATEMDCSAYLSQIKCRLATPEVGLVWSKPELSEKFPNIYGHPRIPWTRQTEDLNSENQLRVRGAHKPCSV